MNPGATLYQVTPVYVNRVAPATRRLTVLPERGKSNRSRRAAAMRVPGNAIHWLWLILFIGLLLRLLHASDLPTVLLVSSWRRRRQRLVSSQRSRILQRQGTWLYTRNRILYIKLAHPSLSTSYSPASSRPFCQSTSPSCLFASSSPWYRSATAYLAYRLVLSIVPDPRAGLLAAALVAWHPAFVVESITIATETFYIFFIARWVCGSILSYVVSRHSIGLPADALYQPGSGIGGAGLWHGHLDPRRCGALSRWVSSPTCCLLNLSHGLYGWRLR